MQRNGFTKPRPKLKKIFLAASDVRTNTRLITITRRTGDFFSERFIRFEKFPTQNNEDGVKASSSKMGGRSYPGEENLERV